MTSTTRAPYDTLRIAAVGLHAMGRTARNSLQYVAGPSRDTTSHEVAAFLLSDWKYGLPGSDGSRCSNYISYVKHKHDVLSICFGNHGNLKRRRKRILALWST